MYGVSFIYFCLFSQTDLLDPKNKKIMDSCFDPTVGGKDSFGWCATCDPDAKKGQRGYCGPGETSREEEAPIILPNSTNWGFCHTECRRRNGDEKMLQARVQLHFISIRHSKLQLFKVPLPGQVCFFSTQWLKNFTEIL